MIFWKYFTWKSSPAQSPPMTFKVSAFDFQKWKTPIKMSQSDIHRFRCPIEKKSFGWRHDTNSTNILIKSIKSPSMMIYILTSLDFDVLEKHDEMIYGDFIGLAIGLMSMSLVSLHHFLIVYWTFYRLFIADCRVKRVKTPGGQARKLLSRRKANLLLDELSITCNCPIMSSANMTPSVMRCRQTGNFHNEKIQTCENTTLDIAPVWVRWTCWNRVNQNRCRICINKTLCHFPRPALVIK